MTKRIINILRIKDKISSNVDNYSGINFKNKEFVLGISEVKVFGKVIGNIELENIVETSLEGKLTTDGLNQ